MADQKTTATKADLQKLEQRFDDKFDEFNAHFDHQTKVFEGHFDRIMNTFETRMAEQFKQLVQVFEARLSATADDLRREYGIIAEQIHRDAIGANRDEVVSIQYRHTALEQRVHRLERLSGAAY